MLEDQEFKDFLKALGTRIRQLRKSKGLDMRDIMIASGYYDAQWRKYEAGGSMNLASLMRVAQALDVSLTELFDGLGQWPKLSVGDIEGRKSTMAISQEQSHEDVSLGVDQSNTPPVSTSKKGTLKTKAPATAPKAKMARRKGQPPHSATRKGTN